LNILENGIINQIKRDLSSLGIRPGGILLVHSSMKSLGTVSGGPETLIQGLLEALGPEGTLLMPALSYASVNTDNPYFDVRNTPCCIGLIPEYFRQRKETLRSVHPTHSVCGIGKQADVILKDHIKDTTPVGPYSPFCLLSEKKGQILMLGCGLRPNTSMHGVEELSVPPYLFTSTVEYEIILEDGTHTKQVCKRHGFNVYGFAQRYDRIINVLSADALKTGKVLQAESYLIEAESLWIQAHQKLLEDPLYFVDQIPKEVTF
jgi:aminoglycoside 3-N-acetyltransferase